MPQVAAQGADTIDLTWLASTDNVGVTGYNIYNADTNQIVATSATNSVTITGLTPGTLRYYGKAFDAAGNLSWRSGTLTVDFAGSADTERPSTPTALMVAGVGVGSVDLTWNPSTDNVGVTGYNIYDFATNQIVATSPGPSTTVTGLAGTNTFYVKAFDAAGNTSWRSNTVTFTVQ
jgi:chitin-binding protein